MSPLRPVPVFNCPVGRRDQIGLVERLAVPDRCCDEVEIRLELHIGVAAYPRRLDLAGNQQRSDFLIGAARDEFDRTADPGSKVSLEMTKQFKVIGKEDRRQAEFESLVCSTKRNGGDQSCRTRDGKGNQVAPRQVNGVGAPVRVA